MSAFLMNTRHSEESMLAPQLKLIVKTKDYFQNVVCIVYQFLELTWHKDVGIHADIHVHRLARRIVSA